MGEERKVKEVKVKVPLHVYERILEKVRAKGYVSVAEFLRDVIRRELEEG